MKHIELTISVIMSISIIMQSCLQFRSGSGIKEEEYREITDFDGVETSAGIEVKITDQVDKIIVSADKDLLEYIETKVNSSGILTIKFVDKKTISSSVRTIITVPIPKSLRYLKATGGSEIIVESEVSSISLEIEIKGGSKASINQVASEMNTLSVNLSGGSKATIIGNVSNCELELSGGCTFNNYDLSTENLNCKLSGGSKAEITCNKSMFISASSGSTLFYKGDCKIESINVSGGSEVIKK